MKKHLLVCLLALALASLCMLPSRVQAAEETHDHCFCGADHVNTGSHSDSPGTWTAWKVNQNGEVKWPKVGGRYYLTDDVVLTETWVVPETNTPIVLCLNGRSITMEGRGPAIEVNGTSTHTINLTITNCKGEGKITHWGGAKGPAVKVGEYGSFTMYGGTITGNQVEDNGGGVYVDGALKMYGGAITGNSAMDNGGGVYIGSRLGAYVYVGDNAQIADNTVGSKTDSGIYFSSSTNTTYLKQKLTVKKLITDAKIAIDNDVPESYITDSSKGKGNYAIDDKGILTAPSHQSHYLCGSSTHTGCTSADCTKTGAVNFKKWEKSDSLPTSGNYYLTTNVKLSKEQTITGDVTLCLNGYKIEAASDAIDNILVTGTLTITDCIGSGSIVGVDKKLTGVNIKSDAGTLNLYGGTIKNFEKGVVNNGTFNMYGGKLTQNSQGVSNQRTFNMHGGTITKNSGDCNGAGVSNEGNFTMSGGDITSNTASQSGTGNNGFGGGVYNNDSGSFKLTDGTIAGNTAKNDGGGVYSGSDSTYIYGGSITSNNAKRGDDVYAASNCGVHLKGNVTIGSNRSNGLLTNTVHYIDGKLDGSAIRLFVPGGKTNGDVLLSPGEKNGEKYTITPEDLRKFSFKNTGGYEVILNDDGNGVLILPHKHTLCNKTAGTHTGAGHSGSCGDSITFEEWTDAAAREKYGATATAANCLPSSGNWYLTNPVTLPATHEVNGGKLNLCLNGNSVTLNADGAVFSVKSGGELNLADCKGTGSITHATSKNGAGVFVGNGGTAVSTFNMYNGNITGNSTSPSGNGGGVSVLSDGRFNMYGGTITNNKAATGGGVYVEDNATVTISGGTITENEAKYDGGGMTVGNCQVTLSGKVTITDNKSAGVASNLYIKGGQGVTIDSSFASTSQVVFKDCDNQYDGTYYITNADKLNDNQLTCLTTDAGRKFVKAGEENKVYVATVLDNTQKPTVQENLVYNGTEQTGVNVPNGADTYYTITGTREAIQANAASQGSEKYTAVVTLKPGYAWCDSRTNTYYVAGMSINLYWSIARKEAAADDFVVTDSTLTTTYEEEYHGVTVTVAKQYKQHSEDWDGKLEVQYKAEGGTWTNAKPTDAGTYNLRVHIANGANFAAGYVELSESLTIKPASQAAPVSNTFKVTAPTSINGTDGQITGVTTDMEYSIDDGRNWKKCDGNTITGPRGDYQIRYAAKQPNYKCSEAVTVNIPVHTHTLSGEVPDEAHRMSAATCTRKAVYCQYCMVCGAEDTGKTFEFGNMLPHEYDNSKWKSVDKTYHARPCKNCGAYDESTKEPHKFSGKEPGCTAPGCGFERKMYKVTLTTNYPVDCHVTTQNGVPVTSIIGGVEEGTAVTVSGNTLHIGNDTFTFRTNNGEQYSYTFTGWTIDGQPIPENYTINKSVTIKATFNRVVNQYTVTWNAAGGTIQDTGYTSGKQDWGTPITAPSKVVKKPDSSCSYTFTGWQDADGNVPAATVTGDVTYTAQYTKKPISTRRMSGRMTTAVTGTSARCSAAVTPQKRPPTPTPMRMPRSVSSAVHPAPCRS